MANFGTFLSVERATVVHWRIISRLLVWVPYFIVIVVLISLLSLVCRNIDAVMASNCHISLWFLEPISSFLTGVYHSSSVLICNCRFGSHHLLILHKILMTRVTTNMLQSVWISATVATMNLLGVMFGRNGNHCTRWISSLLVLLTSILSCTADKNNISLGNTSIVWRGVRSLLVGSSKTCSWSIVLVHAYWETTQILRVLSEIEQRRSIWLLLRCSSGNITCIWTWSSKVSVMFSHII